MKGVALKGIIKPRKRREETKEPCVMEPLAHTHTALDTSLKGWKENNSFGDLCDKGEAAALGCI
jgi:hypothetical protein